jgi:hypothetical protein
MRSFRSSIKRLSIMRERYHFDGTTFGQGGSDAAPTRGMTVPDKLRKTHK